MLVNSFLLHRHCLRVLTGCILTASLRVGQRISILGLLRMLVSWIIVVIHCFW